MSSLDFDKYGEVVDYSIPPEIARLSSYQGYDHDETDNLLNGKTPRSDRMPYSQHTQADDIQSIRTAVSALKPYLAKKSREGSQVVQIQELFPTGESGYKKTVTIVELLKIIKKDVDIIEKAERTSLKPVASAASSDTVLREYRRPYHGIREIRLHDLRHLEEQFTTHDEPIILIRKHVVIMSLSPLRLVIMADKVILVVPSGADSLLYLLHDHMNDIVEMSRSGIHVEFLTPESRVYEAVFSTLQVLHSQEYMNISATSDDMLRDFRGNNNVTVNLQDRIRALKTSINSKSIKIDSYRKLLAGLLEKDVELAMMKLTMLKTNPDLYTLNINNMSSQVLDAVGDIQNMFESSLADYNNIARKFEFLLNQVHNMEDLVRFKLDTARNELLIIDASMNILMAVVACGTLVTSMFGMNIVSGLEYYNKPYLFWGISLVIMLSLVVLGFSVLRYFGVFRLLPSKMMRHTR